VDKLSVLNGLVPRTLHRNYNKGIDIGSARLRGAQFDKDARNSNPFMLILMFDTVMNINVDLRILLKTTSSKTNFA
jgi:hypothetical protein